MTWDVTVATHSSLARGSADDLALSDAIRATGGTVRFAVWNDASVDWTAAPVTIVRSTWDYHLDPVSWRRWLQAADADTRLVNPASLMRWNTDKRYLLDLLRAGIPVVPTMLVDSADDPASVTAALADRGWRDVVVKPSIGAAAHATHRFAEAASDCVAAYAAALARGGGALIQPFQEGVLLHRERSLVYIGGVFSHAFSKPAFDPGAVANVDGFETHDATPTERELAVRALGTLCVHPTYARVDLVPTDAGPLLMELELIEPHLELRQRPEAARILAELLARPPTCKERK